MYLCPLKKNVRKMTSKQIRQKFLDFFASKGHAIVPSSPMVVKNDPTLLFTNAGMNQFKEYILGNTTPSNVRVADTQKCLRVSGKHNDLEEVGRDTYHHTMFEMLGNWSFGDYFKKEAIGWAWELITQVYGIDKSRIYVTIFEGDLSEGLERDNEAFGLWSKYLPQDRIINGNKKDNFWEMGDQGPCGPCSEIHLDLRDDTERATTSGRELVNCDHPRVIEIWNLVFMQFNRKADGSLERLSKCHIDTGMGFERLCMVLQGKTSSYDTDVFTPLISKIEEISGKSYGKDSDTDIAIRVISDHIRAVSFAIADGQLPSSGGAGYVIRRILRRAIRYGFTFLDMKEPFIYRLVDTLCAQMGDVFSELNGQSKVISLVIKEEESSFLGILEQGLILLDSMMLQSKDKCLSGEKAFELYDTYGFPIDLTSLIVSEKGFTLDREGFERELSKQKERSRLDAHIKAGDWVVVRDDKTEEFVGYDTTEAMVRITKYRRVETSKGVQYHLVFNMTPFYAESGGQVGDVGYIKSPNGEVTYISDTKKENNLIIHYTDALPENINVNFKAYINPQDRERVCSNHSSTHLLQQALRSVLGNHVEQRGSRVDLNSLRFDFSHFSKMSQQEIEEVENFVNDRIRERLPLEELRNIPIEQARQMGAMALFGEKYGDMVRVIKFGDSIEFCGGTHVRNTGDIWLFKIISESAVASGVRRIEAITGSVALDYFKDKERELADVKTMLKHTQEPLKAIESLQNENARLLKQVESLKKEQAKGLIQALKDQAQTISGIRVIIKRIDEDLQLLKDMAFEIGKDSDDFFILFGSKTSQDKAMLTCYISKKLASERNLDAGSVVRDLGKYIQGGGGGQPFFATAGGRNVEGIEQALLQARKMLEGK